MSSNKQPFIITAVVFSIFISISLFPQLPLEQLGWPKIDFLSDLRIQDSSIVMPPQLISDTNTVLVDGVPVKMVQSIQDSNHTKIMIDSSGRKYFVRIPEDSISIVDFGTTEQGNLSFFLKALQQAQKRKVRIAHFGDSMIEGDLISNDLRLLLQKRFGGSGVGFVPLTSITAGFRTSVTHSFNNWQTLNYEEGQGKKELLGPSGYAFIPNNGASVTYSKCVTPIQEAYLLYGKTSDETITITKNGTSQPLTLTGANPINKILCAEGDLQKLSLQFKASNTPYYGMLLESKVGVQVDNYSFRGSSGLKLKDIKSSIYTAYAQQVPYDLIILQYGLNVMSYKQKEYKNYENQMVEVIKALKTYYPNTTILVVSVGDRAFSIKGRWQTDQVVLNFIQHQRNMAQRTGVCYWDLFNNMGGYNTMVEWVNAKPPLANKDYVHINHNGGKKVAEMLYQQILKSYEQSPH